MAQHFVGIYSRYGVVCMYKVLPVEIKNETEAKEYCLKTYANNEDMHRFEGIGTLNYSLETLKS
jgi:hypothetical protein